MREVGRLRDTGAAASGRMGGWSSSGTRASWDDGCESVSRDGRGGGGAVHDRRLVPPKDRAVGGRCLATLSVRLQVFAFKHFSPRK
eukprot:scaffold109426_cov59-Phaeocystis_antarctica.AAC.2